jgi:hypothetical protein
LMTYISASWQIVLRWRAGFRHFFDI